MITLDRYILGRFFYIFFAALATLVVFYEMIVYRDYVGHFSKFGATTDMVLRYMAFKAPMALFHVTPICVLLAAILTAITLSRTSEIVAMAAAGVRPGRIAAPVVVASFFISGLAYLNSEYLFPLAAKETERIWTEEIKGKSRKSLFSKNQFWYRADDGSLWNIGHVNQEEKKLEEVSVFFFDKSGARIVKRITAQKGRLTGERIIFQEVAEYNFEVGTFFVATSPSARAPAGSLKEEDFSAVRLSPDEMNLKELDDYIGELRQKGYDATKMVAAWHSKIAFPLISAVMPLIAFPLGVRSSRRGGVLMGVAVALLIGALFWFLQSVGVTLGKAGRLPPAFGAYAAHVAFASVGLYLFFRRE